MSQLTELLSDQISSAEQLIEKVKAIPDGTKSGNLTGFIRYDARYTRPLTIESEGWEKETKEVLISLYGENARQIKEFQECTRDKNQYFKFRENLQDELERCISFLRALIKVDGINQDLHKNSKTEGKSPIVFISHSSKDKEFVEALVNLLEDLGMNNTNVFCSSVNGYGVKFGNDIFETLRSLFNEHELFVLFVHSPRYYASPVSLNEMGAAWVLKSEFRSLLTNDMDFSGMVGVIDGKNLSLKVNNEDAPARLNELKDKLITIFHLPTIDETKWERKRNQFLRTVRNIKYEVENSKTIIDNPKKAEIRAESEKIKNGQRSVIISNVGNSSALNLKVSINDNECWASIPELPTVYDEMLPGAHRTIKLLLIEGQDIATFHFSWDDEHQKGNTLKQIIDL